MGDAAYNTLLSCRQGLGSVALKAEVIPWRFHLAVEKKGVQQVLAVRNLVFFTVIDFPISVCRVDLVDLLIDMHQKGAWWIQPNAISALTGQVGSNSNVLMNWIYSRCG